MGWLESRETVTRSLLVTLCGGFSQQSKGKVSDFILTCWLRGDAQNSIWTSVPVFLLSSLMVEGLALICFLSALGEFKNLFVSSIIIWLGLTHNFCTLIVGVIIGQELLCKRACLILWGLAWLVDINYMEAIKLWGNVMWAEFKLKDCGTEFFFF